MRIGVIGIGDIALKAYLPVLANRPNVELVLCSRSRSALTNAQHKFHISEQCNDYRELKNKCIDAVTIHSSTKSHFEIAKYFLENKIPVLVDKPLSYFISEVEELCNIAVRTNTCLFVGFNRRYCPIYKPLFALQPTYISYEKDRYNLPGDVRTFIFDDFIHVVDSVLQFLNSSKEPNVMCVKSGKILSLVQVSWQIEKMIINAKMNRVAARTGESFFVATPNESWRAIDIENCVHTHSGNQETIIGSDPWQSTLNRRGFESMCDMFFELLGKGANAELIEGYERTHWACEKITRSIEKM